MHNWKMICSCSFSLFFVSSLWADSSGWYLVLLLIGVYSSYSFALPPVIDSQSLFVNRVYLSEPGGNQKRSSSPILLGSTPSFLKATFWCFIVPVTSSSFINRRNKGTAYLGSRLLTCWANSAPSEELSRDCPSARPIAAQPARPS